MFQENQIFWKSDTQGMDEKIATLLPLDFWNDKIYAASLELWRIPGKDFDLNLFEKIIELFPVKTFDSNPNELLDTKDILNYITSTCASYFITILVITICTPTLGIKINRSSYLLIQSL